MTETEAPPKWHWGIGNRSSNHYTYWLYTNKILFEDGDFGYEAEIYWDGPPGRNEHVVNFYEIERLKDDGDVVVCEYPCYSTTHDSEEEAVQDAITKARELRG